MINLKEFCKQIDQNVPNFLQELVDNGKLKNITDELTKYQQNQLNKKIKAYEDAYSTTYLDVL
jgi:F0F1-type ATP synthase delta subunit